MDSLKTPSRSREIAISVLAVIGFISLMGASLWLALYATRFVPGVVNRFGTATVYLSSIFFPAPPSLTVIPTPTASTTIPFDTATATPATTTALKPVVPKPAVPPVSHTYPISGTSTVTVPPVFSGLPDLTVTIAAIGYLATSSAESFVASSTVPVGSRPAVRFSIKNVGTNSATPWRFSATIPTQSAYFFQSQPQLPLSPGESIDYTLGFDQANKGTGQMVSVTANFDKAIAESNQNNNSAAAYLTILGS